MLLYLKEVTGQKPLLAVEVQDLTQERHSPVLERDLQEPVDHLDLAEVQGQ